MLLHCRGSLGPPDPFENGMEGNSEVIRTLGGVFWCWGRWFAFTNGMSFFDLKKAFASSSTMFTGSATSPQVRRWRPPPPAFLEFSTVVCNSR